MSKFIGIMAQKANINKVFSTGNSRNSKLKASTEKSKPFSSSLNTSLKAWSRPVNLTFHGPFRPCLKPKNLRSINVKKATAKALIKDISTITTS